MVQLRLERAGGAEFHRTSGTIRRSEHRRWQMTYPRNFQCYFLGEERRTATLVELVAAKWVSVPGDETRAATRRGK